MTLVELAGVGLFLTLVLLYVCEFFLAMGWSRLAFESGRKVVDFSETWLPARIPPVGREISTRSGKLKFVESRLCLFRDRVRVFTFRLQTPFPLRGTMALDEAGVRVRGRLPVMPFAFLLACLAVLSGFPVVGAFHGVRGPEPILIASFVAFGWVVAALMYYASVWVERKRLLLVYGEIKEWLGPA